MTELERGDVVRLKSGSPAMTVSSCNPDGGGHHLCIWFACGGAQRAAWFHPDTLIQRHAIVIAQSGFLGCV